MSTQSLDMFGTIVFDSRFIRDLIGFGHLESMPGGGIRIAPDASGALQLGMWIAMVPECYRPVVETLALRVATDFLKLECSEAVLHQFIGALLSTIYRELEPQ